MRVLVTGGAGFIGSHIVDALVSEGHQVDVYDSLHPQIHRTRRRPAYLSEKARLIRGDVRDARRLALAVQKADAIFHEASRVGVGQSMYDIEEYVDENVRGTATLLNLLANLKHRVKKLIVASSMSIYGEGAYRRGRMWVTRGVRRRAADLKRGRYEPVCPETGRRLVAAPTPESKSIEPPSIYAQTKRDQEEMCLLIGRTYGIPTVAFRYFNVFGPRQSLDNPYTGVLAIFGTRLLNNHPPLIFEDGRQTRDFVHVRDVAAANLAALHSDAADGQAVNLGTGRHRSILQVARDLANAMDKRIEPRILGEFREGDIRHCVADIREITTRLKWKPAISWEAGIEELARRLEGTQSLDRVQSAMSELARRGLRRRARR